MNTQEDGKEKIDTKSRFLGRTDQYFDRQTVAKKIGVFKQAGKGDSLKNKSLSLHDLAISSKDSLALINLKKFKKTRSKVLGLKGGIKSAVGLAANNDFIEDLPLGDMTRVNTVEYKFYGFYHRIQL